MKKRVGWFILLLFFLSLIFHTQSLKLFIFSCVFRRKFFKSIFFPCFPCVKLSEAVYKEKLFSVIVFLCVKSNENEKDVRREKNNNNFQCQTKWKQNFKRNISPEKKVFSCVKPNFSGNICFLLSFVCRTERKHWRKMILK